MFEFGFLQRHIFGVIWFDSDFSLNWLLATLFEWVSVVVCGFFTKQGEFL